MSDEIKKTVNNAGGVGTRFKGRNSDSGPTFVVSVHESASKEEIEEMIDLVMGAPNVVVGTVFVVRDGVHFQRLDDGHIVGV